MTFKRELPCGTTDDLPREDYPSLAEDLQVPYVQKKTFLLAKPYSQRITSVNLLTTEDTPSGEDLPQLQEDKHSVDDLLTDLPGGEDPLTAKDLSNGDDLLTAVNLPCGVGAEFLACVLDLFPPPVELGK